MKPAIPLLCTALLILTQVYCYTGLVTELRKLNAQFEITNMGFTPAPLETLIEHAVRNAK